MRYTPRSLIGEDVFISYSRADGLRYATALANELTRRGFACRIDQYDTLPGAEIPDHLRRSIRGCRMMVVVASARAAESERVREEIAEFVGRPRRGQLFLVSFGDTPGPAVWQSLALGLPLNQDSAESLIQGKPSGSVLDLIENSFQFRKRNRRLARVLAALVAGIVLTIAVGSWRVAQVGRQLGEISAERDQASSERTRATAERDRAVDERDSLGVENSKQRAALEASTRERELVVTDLGEQRAEVIRQSAVNEALRAIGDLDARHRSRGFSTAEDLLAVLQNAAKLRDNGRRAEALDTLTQSLQLLPRLMRTVATRAGLNHVNVISEGERLVTADTPSRIWDLRSARELTTLPELVFATAVSADGSRFLTATRSGEFRVRNTGTLDIVGQWSCAPNFQANHVALSPDGSAALVGCGNSLRIVDVATGSTVRTIPQNSQVMRLWLGKPDGVVAVVETADVYDRLRLYAVSTGQALPPGRCQSGDRSYVLDPLAERVASGCDNSQYSTDSRVCMMLICKPGSQTVDYELPTQARSTAAFSTDGRLLATSEGGIVRVWNAASGDPVSRVDVRVPSVQLRFSRDGSHLAGRSDALVWASDVSTGALSLTIERAASGELFALAADGSVVVTEDQKNGRVHFWQAAASRARAVVTFGGEALRAAYSPDGLYLVATGREVRASERTWYTVWNRTTSTQVARLADNEDDRDETKMAEYRNSGSDPAALEFLRRQLSPGTGFRVVDGGRLAVSGSGSSIKLWDLRRRVSVPLATPLLDDGEPVVTSDGRYLAPRGSAVVDTRNGTVVFQADRPVLAIGRSGVAVTGEFGLVQIWNIATRELEARLRVEANPVAASFSPDEREIAVATASRVETWLWRVNDLMNEGCRLIAENHAAPPWTGVAERREYRGVCAAIGRVILHENTP